MSLILFRKIPLKVIHSIYFYAPISGSYHRLETSSYFGFYVREGKSYSINLNYQQSSFLHFNNTDLVESRHTHSGNQLYSGSYRHLYLSFPIYEIIPDTAIDPSTDTASPWRVIETSTRLQTSRSTESGLLALSHSTAWRTRASAR